METDIEVSAAPNAGYGNILIPITAEHIANGEKRTAYRCPIALAVQQATGDQHATVNGATINHRLRKYEHDASVLEFIKAFDAGGHQAVTPAILRLSGNPETGFKAELVEPETDPDDEDHENCEYGVEMCERCIDDWLANNDCDIG